MTAIPLAYSWRSLWRRKTSTILTVLGIGLAVVVVAAILMSAEGLRRTLVHSGSLDNVLLVSQPATAESRSTISRQEAALAATLPGIAFGVAGEKLVARELALPVGLPLRQRHEILPVTFRGTTGAGLELRNHARLIFGRLFLPSSDEIVLGDSLSRRLEAREGDVLYVGAHSWRVVGILARSNTVTDGEIWGDVERLMQVFRRNQYSSVLLRVDGKSGFEALRNALANDHRLGLDVWIERDFYDQQAQMLTRFLRAFGLFLGTIFAIGAVVAAMIARYASVDQRRRELGTLRALGFRPADILLAILAESVLVGGLGGGLGLAVASQLEHFSFITLNLQSSSNLSFTLTLTTAICAQAIGFAVIMGAVGGFLPARHANRLKVCDAIGEAR